MAAVSPSSTRKGLVLIEPPSFHGLHESTSSSNLVPSSADSNTGEQSDDAGQFGTDACAKPEHGHHLWGGVSANNSSSNSVDLRHTPYKNERMLVSRGINPTEIVFHQSGSSGWTDSSETSMAAVSESGALGVQCDNECQMKTDRWDAADHSEDSCSDSDPDATQPKCSPETEREIQRLKELIRSEVGDDIEKLRARVPQDMEGTPTSIGSVGHAAGSCKACIFVNSKSGCSNGVTCGFCHFPHKRRRNKVRPCKGKRERHLKLLARVLAQIDDDPDNFSVDRLKLPPSIVCEESTRTKFMAKVESHLKQVRSSRDCPGAHVRGSAASSSAAGSRPAATTGERTAEKPKRVSL